ncbi:hypothetical protein PV326_004444 [Microctonus aethiopoides]|nr:hypothetical protein PV326_004444 [Microctonus aethiopoides]
MGMSEINTWVLIRRYDKLGDDNTNLQTSLERLTFTPGLIIDDVKSLIFKFIDVEDDGTKVLKIRRHDNNLIPLSTLLNGSTQKMPFIIDVVCVHQFCPVERRTVLPSYIDALNSKFTNLEQRIEFAETTLPDVTNGHINAMKDIAVQLANCVDFLDRRLDELAPAAWKSQLESAI